MSPSASWAKWVMPMVARSPSARAHSCSFVYLRSSGYILVPPVGHRGAAGAGPLVAKHSRAHLARSVPRPVSDRSGLGAGSRLGGLLGAGAAADDPDPGAVVGDEAVAPDDRAALGDRPEDGDVEPGRPGLLHDLLALGQARVVLVPGRWGAVVAGAGGAGGHLVASRG